MRLYKNGDTKVPSVTTILSIMDKPGLIYWANSLGLQGIRVSDETTRTASIGTATHECCQGWLQNRSDTKFLETIGKFSMEDVAEIEWAYRKFLEWASEHEITDVEIEKQFVCDSYGGTVDILGMVDGVKTLIDIKTSKTIYESHKIQLAAYTQLINEPIDSLILRIGAREEGKFEIYKIDSVEMEILTIAFNDCLKLYNSIKMVKNYKPQKIETNVILRSDFSRYYKLPTPSNLRYLVSNMLINGLDSVFFKVGTERRWYLDREKFESWMAKNMPGVDFKQ